MAITEIIHNLDRRHMDIIIEPVTLENFKDLPNFSLSPHSCKYCAYWESLEFDGWTKKEDAEQKKLNWFIRVSKEFGNCGFIVYVNKIPVGFAQYASVKYFPTISRYKAGTPSNDAIFLSCLYIAKRELWRKGIGKKLLEKVIRDLRSRGYRTIEAFARRPGTPSSEVGDWSSPAEFFLKMGFTVKSQKDGIILLQKEDVC